MILKKLIVSGLSQDVSQSGLRNTEAFGPNIFGLGFRV